MSEPEPKSGKTLSAGSDEEAAVLVEQRGSTLLITLNRPAAKNAINAALAQGLARAIERANADPTVRAVVLTGAGGAFCAGMDLKAFARGENLDSMM